MRRALELMIFVVASVALVATSKYRTCAVESTKFNIQTTCGKPAVITLSVNQHCEVEIKGAAGTGLPMGAQTQVVGGYADDAGISEGFLMWRSGEHSTVCTASPIDGGLALDCPRLSCTGSLTR